MRHLFLCILLCVFPVWGAEKTQKAAHQKIAPTKWVRVYFYNYAPHKSVETLEPVWRRVDAKSPARGALVALLNGPTSTEKKHGFAPLDAKGLKVGRLLIARGNATINFVSVSRKMWAGDLSPGYFREGVKKTLKQFPSVKKAQVAVDGDEKFYSLM